MRRLHWRYPGSRSRADVGRRLPTRSARPSARRPAPSTARSRTRAAASCRASPSPSPVRPCRAPGRTSPTRTASIRFPAIPPGDYNITYELAGFATVVREGIRVGLGFTATVNTELKVASLHRDGDRQRRSRRSSTSRRRRPRPTSTRKQLASLPNARDFWSILARGARHADAAHRRRRQRRRHADRLFDLRHQGRSASADGRGHRQHRRHQRRRLLLRLRLVRRSRRSTTGTQHAGDAVAGRDDRSSSSKSGGNTYHGKIYADYESENIQSRNIDHGADLRSGSRRGGGLTGDRSEPPAQLSRPERRHRRLHQEGQALVVRLAARSERADRCCRTSRSSRSRRTCRTSRPR